MSKRKRSRQYDTTTEGCVGVLCELLLWCGSDSTRCSVKDTRACSRNCLKILCSIKVLGHAMDTAMVIFDVRENRQALIVREALDQ